MRKKQKKRASRRTPDTTSLLMLDIPELGLQSASLVRLFGPEHITKREAREQGFISLFPTMDNIGLERIQEQDMLLPANNRFDSFF